MNNYKIYSGIDVSKEYFTATVLFDDKKTLRLTPNQRSLKRGLKITYGI